MWVRRVPTDLQAFLRVLDHAILGVATHVVIDAAAVDVNLAAVGHQVHLTTALSIKQHSHVTSGVRHPLTQKHSMSNCAIRYC